LTGELAGDYGYDPLGLGANGGAEKYRNAEVIHARWAMLAAAGIIIPEGLQANGAPIHGGTWFETGAEMLDGVLPRLLQGCTCCKGFSFRTLFICLC
jgi:light-harvesting complex II chlorophyll a/b binding protein 5